MTVVEQMPAVQPDTYSAPEWSEARFRARLLTPAAAVVTSPWIIAAVLAILLGPAIEGDDPLSFSFWFIISLLFVPAVLLVSVWQARILTARRPLHERALTGLSAVIGVVLHLVALSITLVLVGVGLVGALAVLGGLTPELVVDLIWRVALLLVVTFLVLSPYFMVAGAVQGLIAAAVIHHAYKPDVLSRIPRLPFVALVVSAVVLVLWLYIGAIPMPPLP